MEAEAFSSKDVDHLLDTGLKYIPKDSVIARSTADIRAWAKEDKNWEKTRDRIQDKYGYDNFGGFCHVVPNHSIKVLSLVYGGHSFDEGMLDQIRLGKYPIADRIQHCISLSPAAGTLTQTVVMLAASWASCMD